MTLEAVAPLIEESILAAWQWKPIETAPKNGDEILLFCPDTNELFIGYWCYIQNMWAYAIDNNDNDNYNFVSCEPSHWRLLPSAPKSKA
jgi:hypothetical protein